MKTIAFIVCFGAVSWLAGCSSIPYFMRVEPVAEREMRAADDVRASLLAPYQYTLATQYLSRARHSAGHSDYEDATRFGQQAIETFRKARKVAIDNTPRAEVAR